MISRVSRQEQLSLNNRKTTGARINSGLPFFTSTFRLLKSVLLFFQFLLQLILISSFKSKSYIFKSDDNVFSNKSISKSGNVSF